MLKTHWKVRCALGYLINEGKFYNMYRKYLYTALAVIFTSIISLSMHSVIYQNFYSPEINISLSLEKIITCFIRICTVLASILIYAYSKEYWLSIKLVKRTILFAILIMALTESLLRNTIMNLIVGNSVQDQFLFTVSSYLKFLSLSCLICLFGSLNFKKKYLQFLYYLLLIIIATIIFSSVGPIVLNFLKFLAPYFPNTESNPISPPYGLNILIPAYITYLEPTIASFFLYYLIKNKIATLNTFGQGLILGTIIALLHAGLYSIIQIIYSEGNIFYRVFYYGQFLWEYFVLGVLTVYSVSVLADVFVSS